MTDIDLRGMEGIEGLDACPVCGGGASFVLDAGADYGPARTYPLHRCNVCTASFLAQRPDTSSIGAYYEDNYYTHTEGRDTGHRGLLDRVYDYHYLKRGGPLGRLLHLCLRRGVNMFPPLDRLGAKMLDFGCGGGRNARYFSEYGFDVDVYDPDEKALELAKPFARRAILGDPARLDVEVFGREAYDVIILNQVLEHLHDPAKTLGILREALKPGGTIILSVPNAGCLDFRLLGDAWYAFEAPLHLVHFTRRSMKNLLGKVGLDVTHVAYSSPLKSVFPSTLRAHSRLMRSKDRRERRLVAAYWLSGLLVALPFLRRLKSDRLTVYARKGPGS